MSPKRRCKRQSSVQEFLKGGGVMGVARIRKAFFIFYFLGGWLSSENSWENDALD